MGSIGVAIWIAWIVFAIFVVVAIVQERFRVAAGAVAAVIVGWLVLSPINPDLVMPFVASVDIALVLVVHGRDIRLN